MGNRLLKTFTNNIGYKILASSICIYTLAGGLQSQ